MIVFERGLDLGQFSLDGVEIEWFVLRVRFVTRGRGIHQRSIRNHSIDRIDRIDRIDSIDGRIVDGDVGRYVAGGCIGR